MASEVFTIGDMITYEASYFGQDYPILFRTSTIYGVLDRLITEVDYEYKKRVHPAHPSLYILHQEPYNTYGMHMFRPNSNIWAIGSDR